ncbi:MAG TPA: hypothetical protein VF779_08920 [Pyrinomonadaceae bacterium]
MKRICLALAFTLLATATVAAKGGWKNFYSREHKVGFKYSANWKLTKSEGSTVATEDFKGVAGVSLSKRAYRGTNLGDADATLSVGSISEETCKQMSSILADQSKPRRVRMGHNWFYMVTGSEGAAGHLYESTIYRTFHDGRCYQFDLVMNILNINNFEKGTVRQVDYGKFLADFKSMVRSLYF